MDITTEFRSHWVSPDGTRHATRRDSEHRPRLDLQPIVNLEEVRAYADLGDKLLPENGMTSQWFARRVLENPKSYAPWQIAKLVEEFTDDVPHYHAMWRAPFVELRNRWPGVNGKPVIAYVDTISHVL